MKLVLPREHGAWGMLFAPLLAGILISGAQTNHLLLIVGMLCAYLSSYPLLLWVKQPKQKATMLKWAVGYGFAAVLFGLPLILQFPALIGLVIPATAVLLINIRFALHKQERHSLNDLVAICGLSLGAVAAYFVGQHSFALTAWILWFLFVLQFFGSVLHVKTLIREKGNRPLKRVANLYQGVLLLLPVASHLAFPNVFPYEWLSVLFLFSALKVWLTRLGATQRPLTIGVIEIANTVWFVAVVALLMR